jgi:hypothetical protein
MILQLESLGQGLALKMLFLPEYRPFLFPVAGLWGFFCWWERLLSTIRYSEKMDLLSIFLDKTERFTCRLTPAYLHHTVHNIRRDRAKNPMVPFGTKIATIGR